MVRPGGTSDRTSFIISVLHEMASGRQIGLLLDPHCSCGLSVNVGGMWRLIESRYTNQTCFRRANFTADEPDRLLNASRNEAVVPFERMAPYLLAADASIGVIDPGDVPFVAVALVEEHDGIWSNDRAFENLPDMPFWTLPSLSAPLGL